jgi:hypothetical protein
VSTPPPVDPAVSLTLRAALSALFVWAAVHKLRDVRGFRAALAAYQLIPERCVPAFAALLIAAEFAIAAALLASLHPALNEPGLLTVAACAAAGLLCVYGGAIAVNLLRGRQHIDCGCAGAAKRHGLSSALVVRNGVLVVAALASAWPPSARSLTWIDAVTIGAGIASLALLYAAVDGLMSNAGWIAALSPAKTGTADPWDLTPGPDFLNSPLVRRGSLVQEQTHPCSSEGG